MLKKSLILNDQEMAKSEKRMPRSAKSANMMPTWSLHERGATWILETLAPLERKSSMLMQT